VGMTSLVLSLERLSFFLPSVVRMAGWKTDPAHRCGGEYVIPTEKKTHPQPLRKGGEIVIPMERSDEESRFSIFRDVHHKLFLTNLLNYFL
ncbi:MAG: hypothetical protein IJZ01_05775, partial [Paraprevotella sp.]|nr:hypothetical protein [Paraprevotella sp.]